MSESNVDAVQTVVGWLSTRPDLMIVSALLMIALAMAFARRQSA